MIAEDVAGAMYAVRRFAVRHARFFESLYQVFERLVVALAPVFEAVGYQRLERPVALSERLIKGFLFDCRMCGQCVLSSTGMSCPMNCPKNLRNGPCGGVREGGFCEVRPEMRCVWVEAWDGASRMRDGLDRIRAVQPPVDRALEGSSAWLRVAREKAAERRPTQPTTADLGRSVLARVFARARTLDVATAPIAREPEAARRNQPEAGHTSVHAPSGTARD